LTVRISKRISRAYSPLHSIRPETTYPAILVTTADIGDRVVPDHSFKYVATLQASHLGARPHVSRVETRAGHGSGKPMDKAIEENAADGRLLRIGPNTVMAIPSEMINHQCVPIARPSNPHTVIQL